MYVYMTYKPHQAMAGMYLLPLVPDVSKYFIYLSVSSNFQTFENLVLISYITLN